MWFADMDTNDLSKEQLIDARKAIGQFIKDSRIEAKHEECLICGKIAPFCNSHTIPQFCLKHIAYNGKLKTFNSLIGTELLSVESGINNAGTFQIICRQCDSTIFHNYEDPQAYSVVPNNILLNQIALKNSLRDIVKHENEIKMFNKLKSTIHENNPFLAIMFDAYLDSQIEARNMDIKECYDIFSSTKSNLTVTHPNVHLVSFDQLNYVVPIAFQGMIALITGVNGEIINNQYNYDKDYSVEYLHIAIFPLENSSVIITFSDNRNSRLSTFENSLKNVTINNRLEIINRIIMWYAEDYFLSPKLSEDVCKQLEQAAQQMQDLYTINPETSLKNAVKDYDLRRDTCLPNLLSLEYAVV